ncbi:MAG: phosphatase PAP2 family protein [Bacteroidia bacterium]|nr:phosphatase PAP2 family protein [Bacteroidia bacterium]
MPEWLREIDTRLLLAINGANDPVLDFIFYWASSKWVWIPFYAWLLYVLYRNYGKKVLWFLPLIALMVAGSDQLSTLLKNTTERFRPCHEPAIMHLVHLVNNKCGGTFGFVSSHAANTMALATFVLLLLPRGYRDLRLELLAFVLINGYSRMYLGAHYPLDVLCGWLLGFILGLLFSSLMKTMIKVPDNVASGHE